MASTRTVIIPDLHNAVSRIDSWLSAHLRADDELVFLGDYFDEYDDGPAQAATTAAWLKEMLRRPRTVMLMGNHDVSYATSFHCDGWTLEKQAAIREILDWDDWRRLGLLHSTQGFYLSHAGMHPDFFCQPGTTQFIGPRAAQEACEAALDRARLDEVAPVLRPGKLRGGVQPHGGITWLDWRAFTPIPGVNQIVGHTPYYEVRGMAGSGSENYCLDLVEGQCVGFIENGEFFFRVY
jgi:hypothetical protein